MKSSFKDFLSFTLKVVIVHFATYLLAGLIFSNVFNYRAVFAMDVIKDYYIPYDDHNIILGPLLQPIRGLLFALAIWPLRGYLHKKKNGWLTLWTLIVAIGILSTPSAAPSSIEGFLYTKIPLWFHFMGFPEILLQTLAFSAILLYWDKPNITPQDKKTRKLIYNIVNAVSTACFAYIGYAVAAILMLLLSSLAGTGEAVIDPAVIESGNNLETQGMFIAAFIINALTIHFIGTKYSSGKISLLKIFLIYFIIDTLVPFLYQLLILGTMPEIYFSLILGLLPAVIIAISVKYNYKKSKL